MRNNKPWPAGTPAWADLTASDPDRTKAFYSATLGWTYEEPNPEFGGYSQARTADGAAVSGLMPVFDDNPNPRFSWVLSFATDDAGATSAAVARAGGKVNLEPMTVGDLGTMGLATDSVGAVFGWWQSGQHTGFEAVAEPGGFAWTDGLSGDAVAAKEFYAQVFGWSYQPLPMDEAAAYETFTVVSGSEPTGGVGDFGTPPHWRVYWAVADTAAACAKAAESGGAVIDAPEPTPWGLMAGLSGPDGEYFKVMGPLPS